MTDRETVHGIDAPPRALARQMDLRGLRCPLPVLKIRKALAGLADGGELEVVVDDPLAGVDVPNAVRETGDHLVEARREGRAMRFRIRRKVDSQAAG